MAESITREEDEDEEGVEREQRVRVTFNGEKQLIMEGSENISRKEKRKAMKKSKRKQMRKEIAMKQREEEEAKLNDLEEQRKIELEERKEAERRERERKEFEDRERAWIEAMEKKRKEQEEEEVRRKALEESKRQQEVDNGDGPKDDDDDNWEYIEEGPAEIIWQGNEIIVKKKRVRVPKKDLELQQLKDDTDMPTSNPLPPQSEAFAEYTNPLMVSAQQILENVSQQVPNFGTELDKAHCPFHLKTGTCRFGQRCSRVHFYPDKSCTLLIRNMYNGPGIAWEQDEGLEHTDEEVECCYEEFYEDVHTEFLKFGEIVNFKVCRNGSFHLRGNVYIQYKSLDSAVLACHSVNGRFFAGKQVKCEYVNVTRWKVAICGEYMKSRYKTCSHGTACNFIHCFRNPGADYEWADWDKPPPRYWVKKMAALFGYPEEHGFEEQNVRENSGPFRNSVRTMDIKSRRKHLRRSESMGWDMSTGGNYHKTPDGYGIDASSGDDEQRIRRHDDRLSEEKSNPQKSRYRHTHRRTNRYEAEEDRAPRDRDRHRSRTRESSSKRQKVSEEQESHGFTRKAHERDSGGDQSGSDTDKRKHRRHSSRRSSKHSEKEERADGWGRSWHSDSSEEWSDMDRDADNYYGSRRRGSDRRRESESGRNQTINLQDRWDPE